MQNLNELEGMARSLWRERQEDCARFGAEFSMPTIEVEADLLCNLIRRYVAPMTPQVKVAGQRMVKHIESLKTLANDLRAKAAQVAGGPHMVTLHPDASAMMQKATLADMQATDFLAILNAIPDPEST